MLQITDMHLGETGGRDRTTRDMIERMLAYEDPDLVLFTGDQISADYIEDENDAVKLYEEVASIVEKHRVPWAMIFGNKDVTPYVNEIKINSTLTFRETFPPRMNRQMLAGVDASNTFSLTAPVDDDLYGVSNYWLDVHHPHGAGGDVATRIFLFDTGGGDIPEQIVQAQVDWFTDNNDADVPVVAFQHVPGIASNFGFDETRCLGFQESNGIDSVSSEAGLYSAMSMAGNVKLLGLAHNHGLVSLGCVCYLEAEFAPAPRI